MVEICGASICELLDRLWLDDQYNESSKYYKDRSLSKIYSGLFYSETRINEPKRQGEIYSETFYIIEDLYLLIQINIIIWE